MRASILVDGLVAGAWRIARVKQVATLTIEPFGPLSAATRQALTAEGESLALFYGGGSQQRRGGVRGVGRHPSQTHPNALFSQAGVRQKLEKGI